MRLMGLGPAAGREDVRRAYRRLALRYHPDRHGGNESSRRRFIEVVNAYRTLMKALRAVEDGRALGTCDQCGQFTEVRRSIDGRPRCRRCLLWHRSRFLPLPGLETVRCLGATATLAAAGGLLVAAWTTGRPEAAAGACAAGATSLVLLAWTSLRVGYCLSRGEQARLNRRKQANAGRRGAPVSAI